MAESEIGYRPHTCLSNAYLIVEVIKNIPFYIVGGIYCDKIYTYI